MKKLISMLLSAVMLLTVLSGCGGGGEEKTGSDNNIDSSVAEDTGVIENNIGERPAGHCL